MTVLIAGCGDVGTLAGLRFSAAGHRVIGVRRSPERLPAAIEPLAADLTRELPAVPSDVDIVVFATSADGRSVQAYRDAYVTSLHTVLDAVERSGASPSRVLLVSSTAVIGASDGRWVDETSPSDGGTPTAEVLVEAEGVFRRRAPHGTILRLAGIYGPGRGHLVRQVREGTATAPAEPLYVNRIHREDAAAALVHLTTAVARPDPVYLGADGHPVDRAELLDFVAGELGVPRPPVADGPNPRGNGKRCANRLLRESGFTFAYPTYRDGYRELLAQ
ncbi:NAD(P)H-binding protein [Streptomyces iconiensis]|uniref:NAD(P)-binding domain-containing protein n=1 Tax=Streptomyces iconiensis TaxID=1384038 RepID=A0ABT6ZWJ2_9ACTN|nr:NAD(P)H-binding protein [Streptomyces iconiensis]MDJ1133440.1 hypothetical protein [Streptomyces iconiensis]